MDANLPDPNTQKELASRSRLSRLAWLPVPLLASVIAGLWIADLRTVYESRALMVLLNLFFTWLASLCICLLTARGFLGSGQPGLLMFGCGSLLWGVTSLVAAGMVDRVNTTITVHNLGVFGAAACHLAGLLWRGRLPRPGQWLVVGYAGALMTSALIVWAAMAGLTPVFFVQGQGGTLVRQVVLLLAVSMFAWVAWQLIRKSRRQAGAFHYWYGLGLALVATGLTGVVLLSVQGGILGWTNRLTQYLGSAYLFIAALVAVREIGTQTLTLPTVEEAWQESAFLAGFRQQTPLGWALRYGLAVAAVAAAIGLRLALTAWVGPGLPAYITLYPAIMVVALLVGFGPGLVVTACAGLAASYWVLPPVGQFAIAAPVDRLGLVIFAGMGVFISAVAELARRYRHKAAAYDREATVRESQKRLTAFAAATFEGIVESEAGSILDCNEQFARMSGYSVAELRGVQIASLIAPEDRERVIANIREGREAVIEHAMLHKDGTRMVVETHGRPVSPGSTKRLTAVRDITKRKQAESELQNTLQRFYSVLSSMYSGLLLMTDEGRVEFVNQAFCDAYGLKEAPADLVGLASRDLLEKILPAFLHPDKAAARILGILQRGQPVKVEEFDMTGGRTALRSYIPLSLHGKSCGRLWIHTDITERKQAEAEIGRRVEELRAANEELTRFNRVTVGRELRIIELKKQVNELCARLGQPPRYAAELDEEAPPAKS
jgi:PAS domain S-box-containing protein